MSSTTGKGPRLWLRKPRHHRTGRVQPAVWLIRDDGGISRSTGCGADDRAGARRALEVYLANGHAAQASAKGRRDPAAIPVADVIQLYLRDVAPRHARPAETVLRAKALVAFFTGKTLADVNGGLCRAYAAQRSSDAAARRELEDLRAAVHHHRREGLCSEIVAVALPDRRPPRERWLTRGEAASLLRACRAQKRAHLARFVLVALYTGTRASAVCGAAIRPTVGHGWIDLERGVFYRRAAGKLESKKRVPPVPLPGRLLAHVRRWERKGLAVNYVVEYRGQPVERISKSFRHAARDAGLLGVTPHVLRHTAASWLMQSGCDVMVAAAYLGMTPQVLLAVYGHHNPRHLAAAVEAMAGGGRVRPQLDHRLNGNKRARTGSNVLKIA